MENGVPRQPIVVVLGHVDHGKTSLLDALRKTNVTSREAGGITQSIGASEIVSSQGKFITFIDTPGHAAFDKMRSRGAKVADMAVLVVASDDGVMPQTKESLSAIKDAQIPFIVALTKSDLRTAEPERVISELESQGVYFEGRGGDIVSVQVSAKTGTGLQELLDMILLVWEMNATAADDSKLEAVVIETTKDKKGLLVSVVVRSGVIKTGDTLYAGTEGNKVKGIFDPMGKSIDWLQPGKPGTILGFAEAPAVGSVITSIKGEANSVKSSQVHPDDDENKKIVVKASNAGSLEAVLANIPAGITVVYSGIGDVNESDVFLAKASLAPIFTFEAKVPASVSKLAEAEKVKISTFRIIYELLRDLEEMLKSGKTEVLGKAEIVTSFPFDGKRVAGSKLINGRISKKDPTVYLVRGEKRIGRVFVKSIRKQKQEVNEVVTPGEEFGMLFEPQLDFTPGDMIVSQKE